MSSAERGDSAADMWAVGVMLADALLGTNFAVEGRGCRLYSPVARAVLVPAAAPPPPPPLPPPPPPEAELVELVRTMLELSPANRPTVFEALAPLRAWEVVGGAQLQELEVWIPSVLLGMGRAVRFPRRPY